MRLGSLDQALVWEPDPKLGWRSIPGAKKLWTEEGHGLIEINSLGYRDRERRLEKTPGVFRIAVFGDSTTQAVQVNLEQTFCYLLEEKLRTPEAPVEVLNFGVNGYSPIQELLLLKEEGPRYRPDLVILALFLDNDVSGVHPDLSVVSQAGPPYVIFSGDTLQFDFTQAQHSFAQYHQQPFYLLRQHSAAFRLISAYRWRHTVTEMTPDTSGSLILQRYLLYRRPPELQWEKAWQTLERVILEFVAETQRQQIPLVILSVPAAQVVSKSAWKNILQSYPAMNGVEWDLEDPERRIKMFAQKHGLAILQPYKTYQEAENGPPLFFGSVGHMTADGHYLLAQALEKFVLENHLLNARKKESFPSGGEK